MSAQLVFLPWAIGGMRPWSQWTSLALAILAFLVALTPRDYADEEDIRMPRFRLHPWPKLLRFPIFWIGLLFLAYLIAGALNPAWEYETDGKGWWMRQIDHHEAWPAGVRVPFAKWGPWRMLIIYGATWLTVCSVWTGFTRRRTFQLFFTVLATNAFLLAILGIAQRALNMTKMFGFWDAPATYFVSSFVYKNHAGAYFNLLLGLCAGLALWHFERSERRLEKSSPSGLFAFFGTAIAMIVFFSYSRTATLLMFASLVAMFVLFIWRNFVRMQPERRNWLVLVMLVLAFVAFVRIGLVSLRTETFLERMREFNKQVNDDRPDTRLVAMQATWQMAQDRPYFGWGGGSFRFLFPLFQQNYPSIYSDRERRLFFEHAHSDYVELLAEYGWAGAILLISGAAYAGWRCFRLRAWENPLALFSLMGLGLVAIHCVVDFNFFNPAILVTWCVLLWGTIRWTELEDEATGLG